MTVTESSAEPRGPAERPWLWIGLLSAAVLAFLFWLLYFRGTPASGPEWVATLPAFNALMNGLCATCLVAGYLNIRRRNRRVHQRFMLTALGFSLLFLAGYITYHTFHGDTPFPGQGLVRPIYFFILISHIVLSMAAVPLVLATLFFAARRRFDRHRRIARFAFPIWLYVSVTGVAVFLLLRSYV